MTKILKIYIDESGDFGFSKNSSELYVVSFIMYDTSKDINKTLNYLKEKLQVLNYNEMIHTSPLICNRDEYCKMTIDERKKIFLTLFYFFKRVDIKINTILIDKRFKNNKTGLKQAIINCMENMLNINKNYFDKFDVIEIYYDNGQENLTKILKETFNSYNMRIIYEFNHKDEKLFQLADMLIVIDKINYRRKNKMKVLKNEEYFFKNIELRTYLNDLKHKRLK